MDDKIVLVGSKEMCLGFRLSGIKESYECAGASEAEERITELMKRPDMGVVLVSEHLFFGTDWRFRKKLESVAKPSIVAIPDYIKSTSKEEEYSLRELVKKALGFDFTGQ
ncbi:MAG: V-type ATP synthase subunit F [Candidatus Diapherotrites archaeon]